MCGEARPDLFLFKMDRSKMIQETDLPEVIAFVVAAAHAQLVQAGSVGAQNLITSRVELQISVSYKFFKTKVATKLVGFLVLDPLHQLVGSGGVTLSDLRIKGD